ncbi:ABC transporter permease [Ideonella paludis]|uniref:Histidine/lysine/arginine/ornithine transport system permease protein HisM n=1 Tax=Ideonella paludis TaxID=1233411 RepID=A0ABS5DZ58_9BURK|nr:ABC transporter permease [Ideonella paludis]MBQ0936438.1 ABC transporter permease [Ideonella paludis]
MEWGVVQDSLPQYLSGALVTLQLLVLACGLGLAAALPLAMLRSLPSPWAHKPVWLFTYVIRGTPMLVQLFLLYYGLAQFEAVRASALWPWLSSAWFCAVLAFAVNTCAYTTEILHGAMKAVPAGEIEAAKALGMSRWVMLRRIVLPSAFRRALPAYGNEVVLMLHGTSLASVVTLYDLTGAARELNSVHYLPFEAFITAAVFYALITAVLVALFRAAERRWLQPMLPR